MVSPSTSAVRVRSSHCGLRALGTMMWNCMDSTWSASSSSSTQSYRSIDIRRSSCERLDKRQWHTITYLTHRHTLGQYCSIYVYLDVSLRVTVTYRCQNYCTPPIHEQRHCLKHLKISACSHIGTCACLL